jgi:hypothetical protein
MKPEEIGYNVGWRDAKKGEFGTSKNPYDPVENAWDFSDWEDGYYAGFWAGEEVE